MNASPHGTCLQKRKVGVHAGGCFFGVLVGLVVMGVPLVPSCSGQGGNIVNAQLLVKGT